MGPLSSWWHAVAARQGPHAALARLCVELALTCDRPPDRAAAAFLASAALDLTPASAEALILLERSTEPADRRQLWPRYEAFLAGDAPAGDVPQVTDRLIALLFELGRPYSALLQVDQALDRLMVDLSEGDVQRACEQVLAEQQAAVALDELAYYLASCEQPLLAEAAE